MLVVLFKERVGSQLSGACGTPNSAAKILATVVFPLAIFPAIRIIGA
jgi:hypothetical protein